VACHGNGGNADEGNCSLVRGSTAPTVTPLTTTPTCTVVPFAISRVICLSGTTPGVLQPISRTDSKSPRLVEIAAGFLVRWEESKSGKSIEGGPSTS
jgi:hypothetical protein